MFGSRLRFAAVIVLLTGALLFLSAGSAAVAASETGPVLQPLTGWLIGVLIILVFSLLSRHRPSKFGRPQAKRGDADQ